YEVMEAYPIKERIRTYREIAELSQTPLIQWLSGRTDAKVHQRFWVMNAISLEAKPEVIIEVAKRPDVGWISHNGEVRIIDGDYVPAISSRGTTWGIRKIKADSCWAEGYTGENVILGITDTGVDYTHPALQGKWSGYWYVASNLPPSSTPYDDNFHGTHCTGTILGGDGPGPFTEDIGVAFNAKFVAAKVLDANGSGTYEQCLEGLQFMANLKDSVDIKAVSNSWGSTSGSDTFFYPVTRTYVSIGIVPVFANGNSGPGSGTVGCPGSYSNVIGVGATDSLDNIASFSSRGPAPNQPPFNDQSTWLRNDWNFTKPQISAPGVAVRSSVPGGGYDSYNGTSMATPHVTGAIGIICQKNPTLSVIDIYSILIDNIDEPSQGAPYPNNNYGWGRLNVWKALQATPLAGWPYVTLKAKELSDPPPGGNGNNLFEPGERVRLVVTLRNGGSPTNNVRGILKCNDNFITINDDSSFFGDMPHNSEKANTTDPYIISAHQLTPQGHRAEFRLEIHAQCDSGSYNQTFTFYFTVGTPPPPYAIFSDDFEYGGNLDSLLDYWVVSAYWNRTNADAHSAPYSLTDSPNGNMYNGTYSITMKNSVDISKFPSPELHFWHSYKLFYPYTRCYIKVSTNGGTNWATLKLYDGLDPYNHLPWTEENLSLSSYLSSNFKVRLEVNVNLPWPLIADGWYIDDFAIQNKTDNEPPYFTNTTRWTDTSFTGPFPVRSTITDETGVDSAYLYYRINSGSWQRLVMVHQGNNIYQATIPSQGLNTRIDYYLWARDKWLFPNSGCDPVGAPNDGYYSFQIRPVGAVEQKPKGSLKFAFSVSNPVRGNLHIRYSVPEPVRVEFLVYDVMGRKVRTLIDKDVKPGEYELIWDSKDDAGRQLGAGVYFVKLAADGFDKVEKVVLLE
ncbi:MAG: S8 family serine peptidase, partial [candidate division WOR-3 bacterium]